jgi:hypothetical protein
MLRTTRKFENGRRFQLGVLPSFGSFFWRHRFSRCGPRIFQVAPSGALFGHSSLPFGSRLQISWTPILQPFVPMCGVSCSLPMQSLDHSYDPFLLARGLSVLSFPSPCTCVLWITTLDFLLSERTYRVSSLGKRRNRQTERGPLDRQSSNCSSFELLFADPFCRSTRPLMLLFGPSISQSWPLSTSACRSKHIALWCYLALDVMCQVSMLNILKRPSLTQYISITLATAIVCEVTSFLRTLTLDHAGQLSLFPLSTSSFTELTFSTACNVWRLFYLAGRAFESCFLAPCYSQNFQEDTFDSLQVMALIDPCRCSLWTKRAPYPTRSVASEATVRGGGAPGLDTRACRNATAMVAPAS